jgi:hypothetical protein
VFKVVELVELSELLWGRSEVVGQARAKLFGGSMAEKGKTAPDRITRRLRMAIQNMQDW